MSDISRLTAWFLSQVGTKEKPAGSNTVIYNTHFYGKEVSGSAYPWCCAFVWDGFNQNGLSKLFYGGQKTASCTILMNWAKKNGLFVTSGFREGDLILFQFDNDAYADHIGYCVAATSSYVVTIEGNTSLTSNDNGGAVMRRERKLSLIMGAVRPKYEGAVDDGGAVYTAKIKDFQLWLNRKYSSGLVLDGLFGDATKKAAVKALQKFLNEKYRATLNVDGDFGPKTKAACPNIRQGAAGDFVYIIQGMLYSRGYDPKWLDGEFGNGTLAAVKAYQKANKLDADGIVGKNTWDKLFK